MENDHRKIGKELDLFVFSDAVGKGLPLWTERGATLRRIIERFVVDEEIKRGYKHVYTPDIAKLELYEKSGHYPYYQDSMYAPIVIDDEKFMLRPMTCPHHFELYLSSPHSYRELPIRFAELAKLYRYEQSGELAGLVRVRSFCLADAHIICADPEQAKAEVGRALDLIEFIAQKFGLVQGQDYWYRLSLGDRADEKKYYKDDDAWTEAEAKLREVLKERQAHFKEAEKEAAFYGPKIDIQMKDARGQENTAFTVQYDFVMRINDRSQPDEARIIFDIDDAFFPLPSEKATLCSTYLKRCIDAKVHRSIMLYGPPGTGKSTLARALVEQLGLKSFRIRIEDVGLMSNSMLAEAISLFQPEAIILDDFDRANNQASLLETLEFFQRHVSLVIATVNDKDKLDDALLRPGRFDELIFVEQMDENVVKYVLGDFVDGYEFVKSWPIAFIHEYVKRRTFMSLEEAQTSMTELANRVKKMSIQHTNVETWDLLNENSVENNDHNNELLDE
jgi:hypothetical protein